MVGGGGGFFRKNRPQIPKRRLVPKRLASDSIAPKQQFTKVPVDLFSAERQHICVQ